MGKIMARSVRRLGEFDSTELLVLETRSSGVYTEETLIQGNSILSTVFVAWADPGAKVTVRYVDATTGPGEAEGEVYELDTHPEITSGPTVSRVTVTRIHNKPRMIATVTGGNVRFSVFATVVSSFASDLDAALVKDEQIAQLDRDKSLPIAGIDHDTGMFQIVHVKDGRLFVDIAGEIDATPIAATHRAYAKTLSLAPGATITHISYVVPTGKVFTWLTGSGSANSYVKWMAAIDGVPYLTKRNSWDDRDILLSVINPIKLIAGQTLTVTVTNESILLATCEVETFIYGAESNV
jgi:hypothetical protein